MKHAPLLRWITYSGIILFWLCIIGLFLYSTNVMQLLNRGKSINVLVWGQILDKEFLSDFEKKSGIHVNMSYFENNEELFVKLQTTSAHDYDLIMPSDWAVELLIKDGLIKKIDRNKLDVWDTVYPTLCHHYFDPQNDYTIPYFWTFVGLGVNESYFADKALPATWGLIFDERIMPERISVSEDPRMLVSIAALYLFGQLKELNIEEIDQIKQLLIKQKSRVEIYTDWRAEYVLASGVVPVAVGISGDFLKVLRRFDYINFLMPCEGCFALIDSFAIPATSEKDDLVYQFLQYIFRPDIVKKYVDKFDFFPAVNIEVEYEDRYAHISEPTEALFKNINFLKNVVSKDIFNDILISLKS